MSDWEEDYEDDFEDELSSRHGVSSPSVPRTHTTPSPRAPSTAVAPAYGANNNIRPSLESSFDSYESSGIANGGNNGNVLFANSAQELSTPTSTLASSRHSDPTYPTEQPRRAASEQSHEAAYPTNAPLPTPLTTTATGAAASSPSAAVSSYGATPQMGVPQRQSNAYASETSVPAFSAHEGTGGPAAPPGRVSGKPSSSAYTASSSSASNSSDDSRRASSGKRDQSSAAYPSAPHTPSHYVGAERDSVSLAAAGKQSESDTPATPSGTGAAAMLVSTPTTRNVSAPRPTSMNDAGSNKNRAIHQSNYTTVEELDDDPLPQYRGDDGAAPTMVDEELSSEGDSDASDDRYEERQQQYTYPPQHNNNLEGTATLEPEAEVTTPQPPLPQLRQDDEEEPHYTAPSLTSSRASSPTASQAYSDNFTAVTSHAPPSAHPTPVASIRSAASSVTASTPPRPVLPVPTPARTPPSPAQHAPPRRPTIPTLETSLDSAAKNLTAPYSAERPRHAPQRNSRTSSTSSAASSVSRGSRKSSSHDGGDRDGALRAQLLLRITELHADIAAWDNRLARKQASMAELEAPTPAPATSSGQRRGRSRSDGARSAPQQQQQQPPSRRTSRSPQPAAARRNVSNGRGRGRAGAGGGAAAARGGRGAARGGSNGRNAPVTQARLDALREANAKLEAAFVRYGGDGDDAAAIDVQTLVARADAQLQRARARLREVNAAKRALENRDKRAAHTIEEVHRRMPSTTELQDRQLNEGIYARTGLQRTARELRANIDRTRAATQLMESRCAELAAQVEQQHLSSITPKDYEALRATRDTRKKAVERHRAAIAVYSAAVGQQDGRGVVAGTPMSAGGGGGGGLQSSPSSRTTSPRKSSRAGARSSLSAEEKRALVDYEVAKAAQLAEQQVELVHQKAELQARIDELMRRVQQRNAQIQANHSSGAGVYYVGGDSNPSSTDPPPPLTSAAAGSGAAAVRKASLRNVLETPAAKTAHQRTSPSPARQHSTAATPTKDTEAARRERSNATRNSAAAERLRGAVAAARQNGKARASGSRAPPLRDLLPAEQQQPQAVKVEKPLPSAVGTGQRTVRGAPLPSSSALTALADSPRKHAAPWDTPESATTAADAHAIPSYGYDENDTVEEKVSAGRATPSHASHSHTSALGVESTAANDIDDADDGGIEAMLRKIDEDNRRIGEEVFGRASQSPPHTEQLQQQAKHDYNTNALGGAVQASRNASEAYDEVDEVPEEEVVEAGEGSGRSTPDWLREI